MEFERIVERAGETVEIAGIVVILGGILISLAVFATRSLRDGPSHRQYQNTRRSIGRSILLGLELLVAGDIIRTVAVSPSFTSVGVLAAVVVIRTFLSFTLELEITGRWPWQQHPDTAP